MKTERIKTFVYCIVTPRDPIHFDIEWVGGEWWSWSSKEDWEIGLRISPDMKKDEILYLSAREALCMKKGKIDWEFLLSLMQSLEIPYSIPKKMEGGKSWSDELDYSL